MREFYSHGPVDALAEHGHVLAEPAGARRRRVEPCARRPGPVVTGANVSVAVLARAIAAPPLREDPRGA